MRLPYCTASFILLCLQFTRAQVLKMNMKPYYEYNRLANKFPQYDRSMVRAWAKHMPAVGISFCGELLRAARTTMHCSPSL
eukprot:gene56756-biopygen110266